MSAKSDPRPRHQQIAAEIRAEIMSGDLAPGTKLPTTQQLMAEYDITNQTVQRTLSVLKGEGFLVGRTGVGVFVRERAPLAISPAAYMPPVAAGEPYPWLTEASRRSQKGKVTLLSVAEERGPAAVRQAFGFSEQEGSVVVRRQVLQLDGEPTELAHVYFPAHLAAGTALMEKRLIPGGSPRLLAELGHKPRKWVDRLSVRLPTTHELEILDLPDDIPVLRTFRVVYGEASQPVEVQVLVKGGHLYELQYEQQLATD
jgi:GntR family transcriptional regulator